MANAFGLSAFIACLTVPGKVFFWWFKDWTTQDKNAPLWTAPKIQDSKHCASAGTKGTLVATNAFEPQRCYCSSRCARDRFFSEDLRIISPPLFSNDTFLRITLGNPLGRIFYHEKGRTQCILFVVVWDNGFFCQKKVLFSTTRRCVYRA